jgi:hypothetical protein
MSMLDILILMLSFLRIDRERIIVRRATACAARVARECWGWRGDASGQRDLGQVCGRRQQWMLRGIGRVRETSVRTVVQMMVSVTYGATD